jgi:hypothetical protein
MSVPFLRFWVRLEIYNVVYFLDLERVEAAGVFLFVLPLRTGVFFLVDFFFVTRFLGALGISETWESLEDPEGGGGSLDPDPPDGTELTHGREGTAW